MIYLIFGLNLSLTIIIEGLGIACILRRKRFLYYSFLCNLLTNPALNLLLLLIAQLVNRQGYYIAMVLLEIVVVLVEALVYRLLGNLQQKKSILLSFALNVTSFLFGMLIYWRWL